VRVYLDTAPAIYLVEHISPYYEQIVAGFDSEEVEWIASSLTRMECLVKPIRDANHALAAAYVEFFGTTVSQVVPLSDDVMDRATNLRALHGMKTPDAIHLAAALVWECDTFLTNDHRLGQSGLIRFTVL
jgi:predicted nucleic acid-binding protein